MTGQRSLYFPTEPSSVLLEVVNAPPGHIELVARAFQRPHHECGQLLLPYRIIVGCGGGGTVGIKVKLIAVVLLMCHDIRVAAVRVPCHMSTVVMESTTIRQRQ